MYQDFNVHAMNCRINLTGKVAVPLEDSSGRLVMVDVTHPETMQVVLHAGTTMDMQLIEVCQSYGIDYVVVYKGQHTPLY
jgi:molybdopterin biosynthesis enzyme